MRGSAGQFALSLDVTIGGVVHEAREQGGQHMQLSVKPPDTFSLEDDEHTLCEFNMSCCSGIFAKKIEK
jgi:hypothetical protein